MPQQTTAVMAPATSRRYRVDRWFYIGAGVFMILLSIAGFGPSIIDQSRRTASVTPLVIAHGVLTAAWLLLFLMQATLVATGRTALHRRMGTFAPVLAVLMIALGCLTVIENTRRGYDLSGDIDRGFANPCANRGCLEGVPLPSVAERSFILGPLEGFIWFGVLVAAGLWYRRRPDVHKRLMLLALLSLAGTPILHLVGYLAGRWPALQGGAIFTLPITIILLSASAIYDKVSQGRIHPVSLWVPILRFAWLGLAGVVFSSDRGREFTAWVIR